MEQLGVMVESLTTYWDTELKLSEPQFPFLA